MFLRGKCNFVIDFQGKVNEKVLVKWLEFALTLPWFERMTFTIADELGEQKLKSIVRRFPDTVIDYEPPIDLDSAMEKVAQQALQESEA